MPPVSGGSAVLPGAPCVPTGGASVRLTPPSLGAFSSPHASTPSPPPPSSRASTLLHLAKPVAKRSLLVGIESHRKHREDTIKNVKVPGPGGEGYCEAVLNDRLDSYEVGLLPLPLHRACAASAWAQTSLGFCMVTTTPLAAALPALCCTNQHQLTARSSLRLHAYRCTVGCAVGRCAAASCPEFLVLLVCLVVCTTPCVAT